MSIPTGRQVYYDPMLSDFATRNFDAEGMGFVGDAVTGMTSVDKQSGAYPVYVKDGFFREYEDLRAPLTAPNEVHFEVSSDRFYCDNRALAGKIPLEDLANADRAMMLREQTTLAITLGLRRANEIRIARASTSSGGPGTISALTGANAWDATSSADILGQVSSAHVGLWQTTGLMPNTCVIDYESLLLARRNERLLAYFKYPQGGQIPTQRFFDEVLQVQNVIIAGGLKNTAQAGQTVSMSKIWGRVCMFMVANPGEGSVNRPNFLTRFRWRNPQLPLPYRTPDGRILSVSVERSVYDRAGEPKVEVLEAGYYQAEKITGPELAYLIKTQSF